MSKDINKEIEEQAEKMEKSQQTAKEALFETIKKLGPEGIKAKIPTLEKSEKELLYSALEEMKKSASPAMDANYAAEYVKGDVYKDTVIQEDKADDDQDEKLVDPKNAKMKHQGDNAPEGFEGQVIKSEKDIDIADDAEETADEAVDKVKKMKKEDHKKKMNKSEELLEEVKKSDDMMYKMVSKMCGMGKGKDYIMDKCMAKGLDGEKVGSMIDRAMKEHKKEMHKGEKLDGYDKDDILAEEKQSKDGLDKMQKEKDRGDKERPEALKVEKENKEAQDKVDDCKQGMKKSAVWTEENELLKANTGGRNHHFSVNNYYDEVLAKSESEGESEEKLAKSEEDKKEDINDIIEKGGDASRDEVICKSMVEANKEKVSGKFYKSFADNEIAQALGLTEEEAKEILGE